MQCNHYHAKAIAQSRQMLSTNVGILTTALNTKGEGIDKCENDHRNEHQVWDCIDKCEIYASPSKDHCITRHHPQQQVCKQSLVTIHRPRYTMAVRMMTILLTIHHVSILSVNRVLNQNHFQVKIHLKNTNFEKERRKFKNMNEEKFQVIPSDTEDNEDMMQNQNKDNDPSAILIIITIQMLSGVVPIRSVYYTQHGSKQSSIDAPLLPLHHHGNLLKC
eukprot:198294_1